MTDYITKRVPELGDELVIFRTTGGDLETLDDVIAGYHLPPEDYDMSGPGTIIDLGCHIGLTVLDFKNRYMGKSIVAAELDYSNYELAKKNTSNTRAHIFHQAVVGEYPLEGYINYFKNPHGNNAHKIGGGTDKVPATQLSGLTYVEGTQPEILYIKMDIEGEELPVLQMGGNWVKRTRCIGVEIHEPHTKDTIGEALENLGFNVKENPLHENSLYGIK